MICPPEATASRAFCPLSCDETLLMEPAELQNSRMKVGVLSLLFLSLSGLLAWQTPEKIAMVGALMRIGIVLGAFWLAIPTMLRYPKILKRLPWYVLTGGLAMVVFFKYIFVLIPAFIALAVLSMFAGKKRPEK